MAAPTASIAWTELGALAHIDGSDPLVWGSNTVKLMLLEADFDGSVAAFINHASINEIESADSSYPAGGYTLGTKTSESDPGPIVRLMAANISDTTVVVEDAAIRVALYRDTGTPSTSRIFAKGVITGTVFPGGGTLAINFTNGVVLQVGS